MHRQKLIKSLLEVIDRKPEDIPLDAKERTERHKKYSAVKVDNNLLKEVALRRQAQSDRTLT